MNSLMNANKKKNPINCSLPSWDDTKSEGYSESINKLKISPIKK